MIWRILYLLAVLSGVGVFTSNVYAADEDVPEEEVAEEGADGEAEGDEKAKKNIYIPVKPAFVINYGGAGKLKYIKADLSLRMDNTDAANSVRHHMPYIRNNLVMLFSSQTDESISSQDGKEALRQEALKAVQELVYAEDRQEGVVDLYFNNFLIQK